MTFTTLWFTNTMSTVALSGKQASLTANVTWSSVSGNAKSGFVMQTTAPANNRAVISGLSLTQQTAQSHFIQSWVSPAIGAQTINAGTWGINIQSLQQNTAMNFWSGTGYAYAYIFRSGAAVTTLISGMISGFVGPGTSAPSTLESGTMAGGTVTTSNNDVIVFELWQASGQQASGTAFFARAEFQSGSGGQLKAPAAINLASAGGIPFFQHSGPLRLQRFNRH